MTRTIHMRTDVLMTGADEPLVRRYGSRLVGWTSWKDHPLCRRVEDRVQHPIFRQVNGAWRELVWWWR